MAFSDLHTEVEELFSGLSVLDRGELGADGGFIIWDPEGLTERKRELRQQPAYRAQERETLQRWRTANKDHVLDYKRTWYARNAERLRVKERERLATPEARAKAQAAKDAWAARNKQQISERRKAKRLLANALKAQQVTKLCERSPTRARKEALNSKRKGQA